MTKRPFTCSLVLFLAWFAVAPVPVAHTARIYYRVIYPGQPGYFRRHLLTGPTGGIHAELDLDGLSYNMTLSGLTDSFGNVTFSHLHTNTGANSHVAYFAGDEGDQAFIPDDSNPEILRASGFVPIEIIIENTNATEWADVVNMFDEGSFIGDLHTTSYPPPTELLRGTFVRVE